MSATHPRSAALGLALAMALSAAPDELRAQVGPRRVDAAWQVGSPEERGLSIAREGSRRSPYLLGAASLVLPGLGQAMMRQERRAAYAVTELVGWLIEIDRLGTGRRAQTAYRDLAWTVARGMSGPREDRDWKYYDAIAEWSRTGAHDADPALAGVQPETARDTYNGDLWDRAMNTYVNIPRSMRQPPDHAAALAYYETNAIGPELAWSWVGKDDGRREYRRRFRESNLALRTASMVLTGLLANHAFSMADAFVSSSIARGTAVRLSSGWHALPTGPAFMWSLELRH